MQLAILWEPLLEYVDNILGWDVIGLTDDVPP
jgi:hypothetical protein